MAQGAICDESRLEERLGGIAVNQCCSVIYTVGFCLILVVFDSALSLYVLFWLFKLHALEICK